MNKNEAWSYALGMVRIDGIEPSNDFKKLVQLEKDGEITTDDMKKYLDRKYRVVPDEK